VTNVQCRVNGRPSDAIGVHTDGVEPNFSYRVCPDRRASPTVSGGAEEARPILKGSVLYLAAEQRNFIQPGVTQWYRKPLTLPGHLGLVQVWGAFEYYFHVGFVSRFAAEVTRQVRAPSPVIFTVRKTFDVA
jgi:hypothetical protein